MLNNAGVELEVIDEVVFYESSYVKKGRVLTTSFWRCPRGVSQFVSASTVFTSYLGFQKIQAKQTQWHWLLMGVHPMWMILGEY